MTMIRGEAPLPERHPGTPGDPRCDSARSMLSELIASGRTLREEPVLREHLSVCEDCNALYRSSLLDDARLRRTMVEVADEEENGRESDEVARRPVLSPLALARAGFASSVATGRSKASWIVLLLVVGYAAVRLTPDTKAAARIEAANGEIVAALEPLAAGAPARELQRGDWVRIPAGSRAWLSLGGTRVDLAPGTELQLEQPAARRVRLEAGELQVDGPLLVTSPYGIVQVEAGRATLKIDERGLRVESEQGNVRAIDSLGEHELESGESAQLAFAR